MARSSNQKLKILYVMEYLLQHTDDAHPATRGEIAEYLAGHDIAVERKSLYDDFETLRSFGLDIVKTGDGRNAGYYIADRDFELAELKLLVDSVQSSKFITHKKTTALIKKIEHLTSVHQARLLQRQVHVAGRIKTMNESVFYNVDEIHNGISENRKIRFRYFDLTVDRRRCYRKNGGYYTVSPYALTWDNENYYLVAYDSVAGEIRHYRVDKMTGISVTEEFRDGQDAYKALDMAEYARKVFGMFTGTEEPVRMRFDNRLAGAVLDRLGQEVLLLPDGDGYFTVTASLVPSPQFYAWVFGFGDLARILGPENVIDGMRAQLERTTRLYHGHD